MHACSGRLTGSVHNQFLFFLGLIKRNVDLPINQKRPTHKTVWVRSPLLAFRRLVTVGHALDLVAEISPVVCLQLGIFDPLLAPILMQAADMILALLEVGELVADALLDENAPGMLLHN